MKNLIYKTCLILALFSQINVISSEHSRTFYTLGCKCRTGQCKIHQNPARIMVSATKQSEQETQSQDAGDQACQQSVQINYDLYFGLEQIDEPGDTVESRAGWLAFLLNNMATESNKK